MLKLYFYNFVEFIMTFMPYTSCYANSILFLVVMSLLYNYIVISYYHSLSLNTNSEFKKNFKFDSMWYHASFIWGFLFWGGILFLNILVILYFLLKLSDQQTDFFPNYDILQNDFVIEWFRTFNIYTGELDKIGNSFFYRINLFMFSFFGTAIYVIKVKNYLQNPQQYRLTVKLEKDVLINLFLALGCYLPLVKDFLSMFVFIEIGSLVSFYILLVVGFSDENNIRFTAIIKYIILSVVSVIFFLGGLLIINGHFGNVSFVDFILWINSNELSFDFVNFSDSKLLILFAIFCIIFSFLLKLGIFPWHFWVSDLYSTLNNSLLFFFSTAIKYFYLSCFIIVYSLAAEWLVFDFTFYEELIVALGICTIAYGSLGGLFSKTIKRMLAYSAISHSGFIMLAFTGSDVTKSITITLIYFFIYSCTTFLVLYSLDSLRCRISGRIAAYSSDLGFFGFIRENFLLTFLFIFSMLVLMGLPPLAGFVLKLNILTHVYPILGDFVLFLLLFSIFSAFYYLINIKEFLFVRTDHYIPNNIGSVNDVVLKDSFESDFVFDKSYIWFFNFFVTLFVWFNVIVIFFLFFYYDLIFLIVYQIVFFLGILGV